MRAGLTTWANCKGLWGVVWGLHQDTKSTEHPSWRGLSRVPWDLTGFDVKRPGLQNRWSAFCVRCLLFRCVSVHRVQLRGSL